MANDNVSAQQEAELDEELMATFPASDPPSNTGHGSRPLSGCHAPWGRLNR